jgi:hypothetical protein
MRGRSLGSWSCGSASRVHLRSQSSRECCTVSDTVNISSRPPNFKVSTPWQIPNRHLAARRFPSDSRNRACRSFRSTRKGQMQPPATAPSATRRLFRTSTETLHFSELSRGSMLEFRSNMVIAAAVPINTCPTMSKAKVVAERSRSPPSPHTSRVYHCRMSWKPHSRSH